jgi:ABC-type glycerol-3-phosphate transport system substrate-binding protein
MAWRHKKGQLAAAVVGAVALLAAGCGGSSGSSASQSPKTFGVNATGTVHFWS